MEPWVGIIRLVGGRRQEGGHPGCAWFLPPLQPAPGRERERFAMVLSLNGPAPSRLYREIREATAQAFWSTPGSPVAALRRAAIAANRTLVRFNRQVPGESRYLGSLACAALRAHEGFLAHVGPAWSRAIGAGGEEQFPEQTLPSLGTRPYVETAISYIPIQPGTTLLLSAPNPLQFATLDALDHVLQREEAAILDGLEQLASDEDWAALVVRWVEEALRPVSVPAPRRPKPRRLAEPSAVPPPRPEPPRRPESAPPVGERALAPEPGPRTAPAQEAEEETESEAGFWEPEPVYRPEEMPVRETSSVRAEGPGAWARLGEALATRASAIGKRIQAGFSGLRRGGRTLLRRALPGVDRRRITSARMVRVPPQENPRQMAALAIIILMLVILLTLIAWLRYGRDLRLSQALSLAQAHVRAAQQATRPEEARLHWEAVLNALNGYENPEAVALHTAAQEALDRMDGVLRVQPTLVADVGMPDARYRLAAWDHSVAVLQDGRRILTFAPGSQGKTIPLPESIMLLDIAPTGALHPQADAGQWPPGLLILGTGGHLWVYDWQWPEPRPVPFPAPPGGHDPAAIATYEGRLYLLDPVAGQIWRYVPQGGGGFRQEAEPYFPPDAPPLAGARDMTIDGNIYILFENGQVARYLKGQAMPFTVARVPEPTPHFVAFTVDPALTDGPIYLADRAAERIVVLRANGEFCAQLRPPGTEFRHLKAIAISQTGDTLFVLAGGRVYRLPLPPLPCR
ncbi:MAG: hypothetical protein RML46_03665 [Anaerolineae bacterium]|nr:hypothetical protein [Anaerolineae bacterium]MDW8067989.1 hypothetical protein [Anaerolineae bacterium]